MGTGGRRAVRGFAALLAGLALTLLSAAPALANGSGESVVARELVSQALGLIANRQPTMVVKEKIDDAIKAPVQAGVNRSLIMQAMGALDRGDVGTTRTLLERAMTAQPGAPPTAAPVVGEETGTTIVLDELSTRGDLQIGQWALLAGSLIVLVLGVVLAVRYRPPQSVRRLRRQLVEPPTVPREER